MIDDDQIAHDLMEPGQASWQAIKDYFGSEYLNDDQTINRKKLGQLVFKDSRALTKLNELTHPLIFLQTKKLLNQYQAQPIVILDVPLYFESGMDKKDIADGVLVITLPEKMQLQRLKERNHLTDEEARIRMQSQLPMVKKEQLADFVIENTGTIKELENKLAQLLVKIREEG
ncbi:dephospho-CoA kinase [Chlamydia trachomatis]|nr:dephospho-CoA kinase [Chlamydia trachomatis]